MHKLLEYIDEELMSLETKAEKGKLSMQEIQYADTLARTKKNLLKVDAMDGSGYSNRNDSDRRYSERGYSRADDYSRDGGSYANYGPGRGPNAARDRYGRYSNDGYSMTGDDIIADLRELMNKAPDDKRQEFKRFIEKMERM